MLIWAEMLCLLTTDNFGETTGICGGGVLWVSEDGVSCNPDLIRVGFDRLSVYFPDYDESRVTKIYGDDPKMERPKVLMIDGTPAFLYATSGWELGGGPRTVSYVFRINLPGGAEPTGT